MPGMPAVKSATALIVDTCVETMLLRPTTLEPRTLMPVDAPVAMPRAVEAVVLMPGMPALIKTSDAIVDTWVETILLRDMKADVKEETELLFSVAMPRAVDAVVDMPGMPAV